MNALNPLDPSEFFNFQGHNQLIVPFRSSKSCSLLQTDYNTHLLLFARNVTGTKFRILVSLLHLPIGRHFEFHPRES